MLSVSNYAIGYHVRARARVKIGYPIGVKELPSDGLAARITNAVDSVFPPTRKAGTIGQATKVHRAMMARFGDRTPHYTTVNRWLEDPGRLTIDAAFMIAVALGVDPVTLAFGDLPATAPVDAIPGAEEVVERKPDQGGALSTHPQAGTDDRPAAPRKRAGG